MNSVKSAGTSTRTLFGQMPLKPALLGESIRGRKSCSVYQVHFEATGGGEAQRLSQIRPHPQKHRLPKHGVLGERCELHLAPEFRLEPGGAGVVERFFLDKSL
jgi:hypothetical protein